MPLQVSIQHVGRDAAVVSVTGALTLGTALKTVDAQIQSLVASGIRRLVLDLEAVPYMDSAGLGALVYASGLLQEQSGALRLSGVSTRVAAMLKLTRTDTHLHVDPDVKASLAALDME